MEKIKFIIVFFSVIINLAYGDNIAKSKPGAITQSFSVTSIAGFQEYPSEVKTLITKAAELTQMNLTYLYGSANPQRGGMDCSGTIYYLLGGEKDSSIPRSANEMYEWVKKNGQFQPVTSNDLNSSEFSHLKPGDLLFWSGTYAKENSSTITHVMLYLGTNKNHEPLMFGSSDGRTYQNKKMWGVSLFDFKLPKPQEKSHFVGYGCIPSLTCSLKKPAHSR